MCPSSNLSHGEYVAEQRKKITSLAKAILNGDQGIIVASREMVQLLHEAEEDDNQEFIIFRVIESETDHLPLGPERKNWNPQRLQEKDIELLEYEAFFRDAAIAACERIATEFSETG